MRQKLSGLFTSSATRKKREQEEKEKAKHAAFEKKWIEDAARQERAKKEKAEFDKQQEFDASVTAAAERIETPETKMKKNYKKLEKEYVEFKERVKGGRRRKTKTRKSKRRKTKRR